MAFSNFQRKLDFLAQPHLRRDVAMARHAFCEIRSEFERRSLVKAAIWDYSEIDLIYIFFRHRPWLHCSYLSDLTVEYLVADFGFDRSSAGAIVERVLMITKRGMPSDRNDTMGRTNRDFIKYLFVHIASARDEAALEVQLGFGEFVLCRIKQIVKNIFADSEFGQRVFVSDLEAESEDVLRDLSHQLRKDPEVIDQLRLGYFLAGSNREWSIFLNREGMRGRLFQLLVSIGPKAIPTSDIDQLSDKFFADFLPPGDIVGFLSRSKLVFKVGHRFRDSLWRLSQESLEIIANAYCRMYVDLNQLSEDTRRHAFLEFPEVIQAAILRRAGENSSVFMDLLRSRDPRLSAAAARVCLKRLKEQSTSDCAELIDNLQRNGPPWLRRVAREVETLIGTGFSGWSTSEGA